MTSPTWDELNRFDVTRKKVGEIARGTHKGFSPVVTRALARALEQAWSSRDDAQQGCDTWEGTAQQQTNEIAQHIAYKLKLEGEVERLHDCLAGLGICTTCLVDHHAEGETTDCPDGEQRETP